MACDMCQREVISLVLVDRLELQRLFGMVIDRDGSDAYLCADCYLIYNTAQSGGTLP